MTTIPSTESAPAAKPRVEWIDTARGIGILLVVYGHAMRGQIASGHMANSATMQVQDALIYAFHMPLFFLAAGLFVRRTLAKEGRAGFLKGRLLTVVWPYFLWSILQGLISIAFASSANNPVGWSQLLAIPWEPFGQFWFLYALFLCQLAAMLFRGRWALLAFTAVGLACYLLFGWGGIIRLSLINLPFFAVGAFLAADGLSALLGSRERSAGIAALAWLAFAVCFFLTPLPEAPALALARKLLLGLAGSLGTLAVARLLDGRAGWLTTLGKLSMPIFLMHVIASAAMRTILNRIALDPVVELGLVMVVGVVGPYIGYRVIERLGFTQWFGFGRAAPRPAPAP